MAARTLDPTICKLGAGQLSGVALGTCDLLLTQRGSLNVMPATAATIRPIATDSPFFSKVAIAPNGNPAVAYTVGPVLRLIICGNATCTSRTTRTLSTVTLLVRVFNSPPAFDALLHAVPTIRADEKKALIHAATALGHRWPDRFADKIGLLERTLGASRGAEAS